MREVPVLPGTMHFSRVIERSVEGKAVTVVGFGRSGAAAARLAARKGARAVVVQDKRDAVELDEEEVLELARAGIRLELGGHRASTLENSDLIVVSPGVPSRPELVAVEARGVPIISEVELATWYLRGRVLAVTGTNGKSTVTTLVGEMVKRSGTPTFVGGNLGIPLSEAVDTPAGEEGGALVVELSSYQLERTYTLCPRVAVLLNLTPDHLDRYGSMAGYGAAKQRIFLGQRPVDHALVPSNSPLLQAMARAARGKVHVWGGTQGAVRVERGEIVDLHGERYALSSLKIQGTHNVDNALASVLAARLFGAGAGAVAEALSTFAGLPHRMQPVAEVDGIVFLDDSKATNVGAALKALEGVDRPVVLLAGGRDKGGSYAPLRPLLLGKGRALILVGEAAPLLEKELGSVLPTWIAPDFESAVRVARSVAHAGDAVLLAPACSSLDMFKNYEERGDRFAEIARSLVGKPKVEVPDVLRSSTDEETDFEVEA